MTSTVIRPGGVEGPRSRTVWPLYFSVFNPQS
eukprot:UN23404